MITLVKDDMVKNVSNEKNVEILLERGWHKEGEEPNADLEKLKALCDEKGIKYHHRAGVEKLKELLGE